MSNDKSQYTVYTHANPSVATMGDFVGDPLSLGLGFDILQLLHYEDENGVLNIDNLIAHYSPAELKKFNALINQARNASVKQQTDNTSSTASSTATGDTSVPVSTSPQQDPSIRLTQPLKMQQMLIDYPIISLGSGLNTNHERNINKLQRSDVKQLFSKFILLVRRDTPYEIVLTSSYRNIPSEPGFNYHKAGLAIDTNVVLKGGIQFLHQPQPSDKLGSFQGDITARKILQQQWEATGIPKIAQSLGIRWGGNFNAFDPVHFDMKNYFTIDTAAFNNAVSAIAASEAQAAGVEVASNNSTYGSLPLNIGTVLNMPLKDIDRDMLLTESNQAIDSANFGSFLARELYFLLSDKGYDREFVPKKATLGTIKEIFPYMSVWIWSRALSVDSQGNFDHIILNVTPYLSSLTTNVTAAGGSFSMDIAPIVGEIAGRGWAVKEGAQKSSPIKGADYVAHGFMHDEVNNELKRSRFFFEKSFQQNDLVFIRFERLLLEDKRQNLDEVEFISPSDLPNQIFDMIGLLDTPSETTTPSGASVNITLTGRDLIKLLIEDGVYFYPYDFTDGGIFANESGAGNVRLNRFNGQIMTRFQNLNKTIERSLKYIINALASIDICPTDLFAGYASGKDRGTGSIIDKRSTLFQLDNDSQNQIQDMQRDIDDKVTKTKAKIDIIRKQNNVTDGSSSDVYNIIETFMRDRIATGTISETKAGTIDSWTTVVAGQDVFNELPVTLLDFMFNRHRIWLDNRGRELRDASLQSVAFSMEDLFTQTNPDAIDPSLIFYQLRRISDESLSPGLVNAQTYALQDIISELQAQLAQGQTSDGVTYNASLLGTVLSTSSSGSSVFKEELAGIVTQYAIITAQGQSISLTIVNKRLEDLLFNELDVFNSIYQIVKEKNDLAKKEATDSPRQPANGVWQIIKLVIDDNVKNRLLADPTIGNEHGSLLNAVRKICQEPFCEFFTDTYGDQFYFIARKKPFDKESMLSMLQNRVIYETVYTEAPPVTGAGLNIVTGTQGIADINNPVTRSKKVATQDIVISLSESDILLQSLDYSQEAYSWYRLQPRNLISGNDADMAFAYLKAVYFNEFADIYGSKPLDIATNYIPYSNIVAKNQKLPTAYFIRQGIYDLKYLIESHAYLPFTRKGTITLNGDRRIKRGTFVRLESTDEIFYVDAVGQSFTISEGNIDRTTVLQVSRGMVEKYINGVQIGTGDDNLVSYFNICKLPIDESLFTSQQESYTNFNKLTLAKWKVNPFVFNFFLKKLQFDRNLEEVALTYNTR